jgi:hypothetical protein
MVRTHVRLLSARRFAGLLAVLAVALCTTGLARPAMAAPMDVRSMASVMATQPDRAHVEERAASSCPMGGTVMDCQPSVQHRPAGTPLPPAAHVPSTVAHDVAAPVDAQRAPPRPASREGPDLDRLCVSRT